MQRYGLLVETAVYRYQQNINNVTLDVLQLFVHLCGLGTKIDIDEIEKLWSSTR
jgi:hypothetical protein